MLLEAASAFGILGIAIFFVGFRYRQPQLLIFGAIIIIGLGGVGVLDGYQVATGETRVVNNTTNTTTINTTYSDVDTIANFPIGIVVILLGTVMLFTGASEAEKV